MFVKFWLAWLFQSISWRKWAGTRRSKNSYSVLERLTCEVKKTIMKKQETFSIFYLLKNKTFKTNLLCHVCKIETMCTLIYFTTRRRIDSQNLHQVAYNSPFFKSLPCMELSCFPEDFRNFYVAALMFQNHDVTDRKQF